MRTLVENILNEVVSHPGSVEVTEVSGEKTSMYEIRCHAEDIGKIIGKNGKTIGAARNLMSTLAARDGRKAVLEIVE